MRRFLENSIVVVAALASLAGWVGIAARSPHRMGGPQSGGQGAAQDAQSSAAPEAMNPYAPAPYRLVRNWPPPDPAVRWAEVIQTEPDAQGNLWVLHRGSPPILKLDPKTGKVLAAFGAGMFAGPHGFTIDADGNLYVTDCPLGPGTDQAALKAGKGYQLFKMDQHGEVLMTIGKAGYAMAGPESFVCPTDVAVAANGDIFVTDGHRSAIDHYGDRVAKFSKDGKFIKDIVERGSGPGQVWQPHSIAIDAEGRLFVADRSNNRLEIFDQEGHFIDIWRQFSRPSGIFIDKKTDTIYVSDSESSPQNHPGWPRGIRIGNTRTGAVNYFISGTEPEGVGVDLDGNVYGCIVSHPRLEKYEPIRK
jgi:DNA-binding beta-propeller fold protein YncE